MVCGRVSCINFPLLHTKWQNVYKTGVRSIKAYVVVEAEKWGLKIQDVVSGNFLGQKTPFSLDKLNFSVYRTN